MAATAPDRGEGMGGLLEGRRAYVTGGSSGIGAAIVEAFAGEGARLVIGASRRAKNAQEAASRLTERGVSAVVVTADLMERDQTERAAEEAVGAFGGLDIFVHCAG